MTPLFTLARQAATYQAGIPTQSWVRETGGRRLCVAVEGLMHRPRKGVQVRARVGVGVGGCAYTPPARPQQLARPTVRRHALSPGFLQQLMPTSNETFKIQESLLHTGIKQVNLSIYSLYKFEK